MNRRGGASIAALGLALLLTASAAQLADSVRRLERRSFEAELEVRARARIFQRAIDDLRGFGSESADERRRYEEPIGSSTLEVTVAWGRRGGRWTALSWAEVRRWPAP